MTRVALPRTGKKTGCYGLQMQDGTTYDTRPGGTVTVDDRHVNEITSSTNAQLGIISTSMQTSLATKRGRWCPHCTRRWQAWTEICHSCGRVTEEEQGQ
jgi:hypothetical protein